MWVREGLEKDRRLPQDLTSPSIRRPWIHKQAKFRRVELVLIKCNYVHLTHHRALITIKDMRKYSHVFIAICRVSMKGAAIIVFRQDWACSRCCGRIFRCHVVLGVQTTRVVVSRIE